MKYCGDTWFLIQFSKGNEKAERILKEVTDGKDYLIIPSITFTELIRKLLHKGRKIDEVLDIFKNLEKVKKIQICQTTKEIVVEAGKISHTFNVPTVDSIIASTAKMMKCDIILSKDDDYEKFCKTNKIKLKNW
ncbi:MAG: type II toxin-antitoxin system VapC family toxin [Candidatus Aenigmarchaeota archaeon]|nr:type II toxin-antitoxin system VapC family toxin [Candidatus Aenigmarchaeota archaeon]